MKGISMHRLITGAAALLLIPASLQAQSLAARLRAAGDGPIHLSFAARPGVCSSGGHGITLDDRSSNDEWESDCERGPVRLSLRMRGGRIASAEMWVGGRWKAGSGATDLGTVSAPEAAALLLDLVPTAGGAGEDLVSAATLADSAVVWPTLLRLARDQRIPEDTREKAVFWLGQAAGAEATRGLDSIVHDDRGELDVRKQAVFALSQRPTEEAVPALIRIARSSREPEILKSALFWLGQSDDPRAIGLFEEILR
jgi:PBS lyase HEAT-like repeat